MLLLFTVASVTLFAGTTGKLAGRVVNEDGEPIAYVNIAIMEGATVVTGGQTKENGTYVIINIPPGVYDVNFSNISYHNQKITGVKINLDETRTLNASLKSASIEIEGFDVVEAAVEKVNASKTGSGTSISLDELEDSSVDNIDDAISQTAGVEMVDGEVHVRGGRSNEVVYTVDGLSVSDPVDGGSALSVDLDAVQVMDVQTGGFTAEFGNAQSGIINIVTKDGDPFYSGKFEGVSDHLINSWDNSNSDEIKFAFGGPVLGNLSSNLKDKFTFFINGSANWHDSRYVDLYASDPNDIPHIMSQYTYEDPYKDRDDFIGFDYGTDRNYNLYGANFKTKYQFNPKIKATFAVRGNSTVYTPYNHAWRYALEHYVKVDNQMRQYIATYDQTIGTNANLKVKTSWFSNKVNQGPNGIDRDSYYTKVDGNFWETENGFDLYHLDDNNRNYTGIDVLTENGVIGEGSYYNWTFFSDGQEQAIPNYVTPGALYGVNVDDETNTFNLRSDFEYQAGQIHGLKTGFEVIKHNIRKDRITNPWNINETRYDDYLANNVNPDDIITVNEGEALIDDRPDSPTYGEVLIESVSEDLSFYTQEDLYLATLAAAGDVDGYEANPWQGAYYLQDKMEWEGMIVNAGLRFDMWYLGEKYKRIKSGDRIEWYNFEDDEKFQLMVSPRFGVSHPISDKSVVHFAYNYQNQLPPMQYVFTSASPSDAIGATSNITIGNPELEPQITVTYEVGLKKQLSELYTMDIQAYYKNIYNYVTTQKMYLQDDGSLVSYQDAQGNDDVDVSNDLYQYISQDYGSVRGIDFNISRSLSNFIQGSASYTLAWAEGNNSGVTTQDEATSLREFPLDWDARHSFSTNITFRVGKDEEWFVPFTGFRFPMDDFSLNFNYSLRSGKPYTPQTEQGNALDTNSETIPHYENADLQFTKTIKLNNSGKTYFKTYAKIGNLFNRKNINSVYAKTGSASNDGEDLSGVNSDYVPEDLEYIYDGFVTNPGNWTVGRTFTVGLSFHF